jgi:hypothetical protein
MIIIQIRAQNYDNYSNWFQNKILGNELPKKLSGRSLHGVVQLRPEGFYSFRGGVRNPLSL